MHGVAFLFVLLTVMVGATLQNQPPNGLSPFVGDWTANLSKSKLNPNYRIQGATLQFVVAGDTVTIISSTVNAAGQEQHGTDTFITDGEEHPIPRSPGVVTVVRWISTHILETVAKKDGKIAATGTYEVSADGKTLTARMVTADFEQVVVFERR